MIEAAVIASSDAIRGGAKAIQDAAEAARQFGNQTAQEEKGVIKDWLDRWVDVEAADSTKAEVSRVNRMLAKRRTKEQAAEVAKAEAERATIGEYRTPGSELARGPIPTMSSGPTTVSPTLTVTFNLVDPDSLEPKIFAKDLQKNLTDWWKGEVLGGGLYPVTTGGPNP
jgi:hypothetical protein